MIYDLHGTHVGSGEELVDRRLKLARHSLGESVLGHIHQLARQHIEILEKREILRRQLKLVQRRQIRSEKRGKNRRLPKVPQPPSHRLCDGKAIPN